MIPRSHISREAAARGVTETVIEKDYCLNWVLHALAESDTLGSTLVFKGGTALRKLYYPDWRFSEDLDFTAQRTIPADTVKRSAEDICAFVTTASGIELSLLDPKWDFSAEHLTFYFGFIGPLGRVAKPREIKVDISFNERIVSSVGYRKVYHPYSEPKDPTILPAYTLEEILAEKFRSLVQRVEPRDLYDIWRILAEPPQDFNDIALSEMVAEKFTHKRIRYEGIQAIVEPNQLNRFEGPWESRLAAQVDNLPDFHRILREVRRSVRQLAE